jgi:hypothetical protein
MFSRKREVGSKASPFEVTARGFPLDMAPECVGELEATDPATASAHALRERLNACGYLYIRRFFNRSAVQQVRGAVCEILHQQGLLDPDQPVTDCVPHPGFRTAVSSQQGSSPANDKIGKCPELQALIYGERVMSFFRQLFSQEPRHFDYTWARSVAPGLGTVPHCDIVYMGRGTHKVYTMWTPYGDIPLEMGGLMVLEGSTSDDVQSRLATYTSRDVDDYCENRPIPDHIDFDATSDNKVWSGWLARNPASLRKNLGGRWLTAEYTMGDVVVFPISLVHGSLDNQTDRYRLSSDSRYQSAIEPFDERFVGNGPFGHVGKAKRGRVC